MDFTSVLKNEVFRPLTTLVVPGAVAIAPYVLLTIHYVPQVETFWHEHPNAFVSIIVVVVLTAGLLIENIGTAIEYYAWDKVLEKRHAGHWDEWQRYLQLKITDEYVGQRYLRNTLVRMKFELAMPTALTVFIVGLAWLNCIFHFWSAAAFAWFASATVVLAVALLTESYKSARILSDTRRLLLAAENATLRSAG